jgi:hypothetical protein
MSARWHVTPAREPLPENSEGTPFVGEALLRQLQGILGSKKMWEISEEDVHLCEDACWRTVARRDDGARPSSHRIRLLYAMIRMDPFPIRGKKSAFR